MKAAFPVPFIILITLTASCQPLSSIQVPIPSATAPPPSETPTPTIIWFPPTSTPTRSSAAVHGLPPTSIPTPSYGELIFKDDFSDPARWTRDQSPDGKVTIAMNELTIAISSPEGYVYSLLTMGNLSDYYFEITANPTICRGPDEYGLLLRVSPSLEFYRFALTCDGRARVDRFLSGQASSPIPPRLNSAVPPGAPSHSRLGVWAYGKELRFYANGRYLFSLKDPSLLTGEIGVFARAMGPKSLTVNFSELAVYAINP